MKRNHRKWLMLALSVMLAAGAPLSVSAEETGQNDTGNAGQAGEAVPLVKPEVYQVVLPTDLNDTFDFILDPQKLIEETNAAAYGGKSFEKGATMFFHRSDGQSAVEYSSSSDHVTISNRSNVPVEIQVDVSILPDTLGGIAISGDQGFTGDERASIYLAITDGQSSVPVRMEGSFIRATIPAAPENAFEYRYDQRSGQYTYGLKSDLSNIQFPEYSFQLTGAVNEKGEWKDLGKAMPMVNVTWKVAPVHNAGPDGEDNQGQDQQPEQGMVIKQILETVPVEKEEDGRGKEKDHIEKEEDADQQDQSGGQDDSGKQDNSGGQDDTGKQDGSDKQGELENIGSAGGQEDSGQQEDAGQSGASDKKEGTEQDGASDQKEGSGLIGESGLANPSHSS